MFDSLKIKGLSYKMDKFLNSQEYLKTIECADAILDLAEKNLLALKSKSDSLHQLGDFEGSLECANVIVDLEPTPFNLSNKSVLLWFLGHVEESFKILDDILHNCKDYNDAFNNKSIFLYGLCRYDEALELCDYVLEKDPKFWMPYI